MFSNDELALIYEKIKPDVEEVVKRSELSHSTIKRALTDPDCSTKNIDQILRVCLEVIEIREEKSQEIRRRFSRLIPEIKQDISI